MILLQAGGVSQILFLVAIMAVFVLFIIVPQFKRQRELKKFRNGLKKGDSVVTTGGILGKVTGIADDSITIVTDEKTKIRVAKQAVVQDITSVPQAR